MQLYVGRAGWSYSSWKNHFYPSNIDSTSWLNYYSRLLLALQLPYPFIIPIAKPKPALPVNGMPKFVIIELLSTPPLEVVTVFTTVDKTP
jgi:hypothetical protein